jgi:hypothetical protein
MTTKKEKKKKKKNQPRRSFKALHGAIYPF